MGFIYCISTVSVLIYIFRALISYYVHIGCTRIFIYVVPKKYNNKHCCVRDYYYSRMTYFSIINVLYFIYLSLPQRTRKWRNHSTPDKVQQAKLNYGETSKIKSRGQIRNWDLANLTGFHIIPMIFYETETLLRFSSMNFLFGAVLVAGAACSKRAFRRRLWCWV